MWFKAILWPLLYMVLSLVRVAKPATAGWPDSLNDEDVNIPALEWLKVLELAAVLWVIPYLLQQLVKQLTSLGVYDSSGPRPASEQTIHCSMPYPALCIFSTCAIQTLFRHDGPICFAGLPAEALDFFSQSCIQKALHHTGRDSAYSLPLSALKKLSSSAMQHYWRSLVSCLTAITMAALDLFEGSLVQQSVEKERMSMLLSAHIHPQGHDLGSPAAMVSTEAAASPNISSQPVLLRALFILKRATSGLSSFSSFGKLSLTASAAPTTAPMQPQADTGAPPITTPPETPLPISHSSGSSLGSQLFSRVSTGSCLLPAQSLIPGLLHSSNPILTAVQRLKQPMSEPHSHLTNPFIGQGELAGEDCTHSSSMETGAQDASPTSSSGVRGASERNTSSLLDAVEEEPAPEKAGGEEADNVFLDKTKGLQHTSSSLKGFTIKAVRWSKDVEVLNDIEGRQTAALERITLGAKAKGLAARFVSAALGGSRRPYVTPGGLIGLAED